MTCKDCMYCNECIMSSPDGAWMACDDFIEKCDNDCEHCDWTECPKEREK